MTKYTVTLKFGTFEMYMADAVDACIAELQEGILRSEESVTMDIRTYKKMDARIAEIRRAFAKYHRSEGCSCCEGDTHVEDTLKLAELLGVPKFSDGSGYDFERVIKEGK